MFLLDTNVISDPVGRNPSPIVAGWLSTQPSEALHLSKATVQEIEFGIARLGASRRLSQLKVWWDEILDQFDDRLIPIDGEIALAWGRLRARADAEMRTIPVMDAVLAATAQVHGLTLVTRNVRHVEVWGGPVVNPWG